MADRRVVVAVSLWQYPQDVRVADLVSLFFLNRQFGPALRTIVVRSIQCVVLFPLSPSSTLALSCLWHKNQFKLAPLRLDLCYSFLVIL